MAYTYDVGQQIRFTAVWSIDDVETSPNTVRFKVKKPSGDEESYVFGTDSEVTQLEDDEENPIAGNFQFLYTVDEGGMWVIRAEGVNTAQGAIEKAFLVKESAF